MDSRLWYTYQTTRNYETWKSKAVILGFENALRIETKYLQRGLSSLKERCNMLSSHFKKLRKLNWFKEEFSSQENLFTQHLLSLLLHSMSHQEVTQSHTRTQSPPGISKQMDLKLLSWSYLEDDIYRNSA